MNAQDEKKVDLDFWFPKNPKLAVATFIIPTGREQIWDGKMYIEMVSVIHDRPDQYFWQETNY